MPNTLVLEPTAEEARKLEAELTDIFAKVERIEKDQQETARLRAETRKVLSQLPTFGRLRKQS